MTSFSKEKQNQIREKIQGEISKLAKNNKLFICQMPTGSGKGKACMKSIDNIDEEKKWLVVVPEIIQIENLKKDIEKHKFEHLYDSKIEDIICYASLEKYAGRELNIWLNECHRLSSFREEVVKSIKFDRIIADSATIPEIVRERLYSLGRFEEYNISFSEAIQIGLIPKPVLNVVYTTLDNIKKRNKLVFSKTKFSMKTDLEYSMGIDSQMDYWINRAKSEREFWIGNKIKRLGSDRKRFIANTKTEALEFLIEKLKDKKVLCYAGSVEQADKIGGNLSINSYKSKAYNLQVLEDFNSGKISKIYMYNMGREGLNLEDIDTVVITQLSSGKDEGLELIQKMGRGLRSSEPSIYILVAKNTMDEGYLSRILPILEKELDINYLNFDNNKKILIFDE